MNKKIMVCILCCAFFFYAGYLSPVVDDQNQIGQQNSLKSLSTPTEVEIAKQQQAQIKNSGSVGIKTQRIVTQGVDGLTYTGLHSSDGGFTMDTTTSDNKLIAKTTGSKGSVTVLKATESGGDHEIIVNNKGQVSVRQTEYDFTKSGLLGKNQKTTSVIDVDGKSTENITGTSKKMSASAEAGIAFKSEAPESESEKAGGVGAQKVRDALDDVFKAFESKADETGKLSAEQKQAVTNFFTKFMEWIKTQFKSGAQLKAEQDSLNQLNADKAKAEKVGQLTQQLVDLTSKINKQAAELDALRDANKVKVNGKTIYKYKDTPEIIEARAELQKGIDKQNELKGQIKTLDPDSNVMLTRDQVLGKIKVMTIDIARDQAVLALKAKTPDAIDDSDTQSLQQHLDEMSEMAKNLDPTVKEDKAIIDSIEGFKKLLKTYQTKGVVAKVSLIGQIPTAIKSTQTAVNLFTAKS